MFRLHRGEISDSEFEVLMKASNQTTWTQLDKIDGNTPGANSVPGDFTNGVVEVCGGSPALGHGARARRATLASCRATQAAVHNRPGRSKCPLWSPGHPFP